jgi:hypothetical protein
MDVRRRSAAGRGECPVQVRCAVGGVAGLVRGGGRVRAGDDHAVVAGGGEVADVGVGLCLGARHADVGVDRAQARIEEGAAVTSYRGVDHDRRAWRWTAGACSEQSSGRHCAGGEEGADLCSKSRHTYYHTTYDFAIVKRP